MGKINNLFRIVFCCFVSVTSGCAQEVELYPHKYKVFPGIPSPSVLDDSTEIIISIYPSGEYSVLPVTQEKGEIYSCLYNFNGKGDQTMVAAPDFPPLGKTGLHADEQLDSKTMITGRTLELINYIARPERFSHSGFLVEDEDIISVLKGDNGIVRKMGLIHAQLAKPLFHIWNAFLGQYLDRRDISSVYYNSNHVYVKLEGGR